MQRLLNKRLIISSTVAASFLVLVLTGAFIAHALKSQGHAQINQPTYTVSNAATTKTFYVPNQWTLAWTYDCTNSGTSGVNAGISASVNNANGTPNSVNQGIVETGLKGSGAIREPAGGIYSLSFNTSCTYTVSIEQHSNEKPNSTNTPVPAACWGSATSDAGILPACLK